MFRGVWDCEMRSYSLGRSKKKMSPRLPRRKTRAALQSQTRKRCGPVSAPTTSGLERIRPGLPSLLPLALPLRKVYRPTGEIPNRTRRDDPFLHYLCPHSPYLSYYTKDNRRVGRVKVATNQSSFTAATPYTAIVFAHYDIR